MFRVLFWFTMENVGRMAFSIMAIFGRGGLIVPKSPIYLDWGGISFITLGILALLGVYSLIEGSWTFWGLG